MTPEKILRGIHERAGATLNTTAITDPIIRERVDYVCRCMNNRAGVRLLLSCLLGKLDKPNVDPRKPYTEIGGTDSFSGRTYDERHLTKFINEHRLPVNPTTAFLTPTLRNIDHPLTTDRELVGRPRDLYKKTFKLLEDVAEQRVAADVLFVETVRVLMLLRDEKLARMDSLMGALERSEGALPLSSEAIVALISQHLACKNASRLPVLVVAAGYKAAEAQLAEIMLPLNAHNAADLQTGSLADVEICLMGEDSVVTAYEMKMKRVTQDDIDAAVTKIARAPNRIQNYLFVTTAMIDPTAKLPVVGKLLNVGSSSFVTLLFGRHCGQLRERDASSSSRASTPSCCRVLSSSTARCFKLRDNAGAMWISMPFLPTREGRVATEGVERLARSSAVSRLDLTIEG